MLERSVGHGHHQIIGCEAVSLDHNRAPFLFRQVKRRSKFLHRYFLVPHVNGWVWSARDADDLLVWLRAEGEARERHRHRNAGLENEIRAEKEKEDEKKNDIEQRKDVKPAEVELAGPGQLHFSLGARKTRRCLNARSGVPRFSPGLVGS